MEDSMGSKAVKRVFLAGVAVVALAVADSARAADLPRAMPMKAPVMAPVYNWSGFYVGGSIGYDWGTLTRTSTSLTTGVTGAPISFSDNGVFGGGQLGYNWTWMPNIIFGIEADVFGAGINGSNTVVTATNTHRYDDKVDWFGTVRGRLGYAVNNWLFYGTGGFAWAHDQLTRNQLAGVSAGATPGTAQSASITKTGWTAGGGIEVGLAANWSVKAEYLYLRFGTDGYLFPTAARQENAYIQMQTARIGVNYRF
jgi:outer membrane immunogenic protein